MKTFGAFHIKTHLSQILDVVEEQGESIAITRHGRTIAIIVPAPEADPIIEAIESIRKNRRGITLGKKLSIKKLIEEGRR